MTEMTELHSLLDVVRPVDPNEPDYITSKLPSGMTVELGWDWEERPEHCELILYPHLCVYKKRSKKWPEDPSETTGRDGLLPAIWAIQTLEKAVELWLKEYDKVRVCIEWEDSRRREIYGRVLGKRGYYFTMWDGYKVLEKVYIKEIKWEMEL